MAEQTDQCDVQFFQLTFSLHSAAMQQMGKVISPISGKIERDLSMARTTIDMLEMLQRKTAGNLNKDDKELLDRFLYDLRMNYVDEAKKGESPDESEEPDAKAAAEEAEKPSGESADQDK